MGRNVEHTVVSDERSSVCAIKDEDFQALIVARFDPIRERDTGDDKAREETTRWHPSMSVYSARLDGETGKYEIIP
jgi:hypothetical protein